MSAYSASTTGNALLTPAPAELCTLTVIPTAVPFTIVVKNGSIGGVTLYSVGSDVIGKAVTVIFPVPLLFDKGVYTQVVGGTGNIYISYI